jgi:capsular exopolysaccharide synthesis family protein
MENGNGLTNALTGNHSIRELVKKTAIDNLYLLGRGELSPRPAELLGSGKMDHVLASLRELFPFIIIDSAPLLPIVDTTLLSTMVDGVVLVVKGQKVSRHVVRKAHERLAYVKAKVLGVILNSIDISSPEYTQFKQSYTSYYANYNHKLKVNNPQPPG